MSRSLDLLVVAGEVSGDLHAGRLLAAIRRRVPETRAFGVGGDCLRAAGMQVLHDVQAMAAVGFSEVLRRLPFFHRVFRELLDLARARRPDAVLLTDYPGFNLRFARRVHALGIPVIYYICPQVWAWNRRRIPLMARVVDDLITIFPFERDVFAGLPLRVHYAGNPLVDQVAETLREPPLPLPWEGPARVALLPGSRRQEVERILPPLWRAAGLIAERRPEARFIVAAPSRAIGDVARATIQRLGGGPSRVAVLEGVARPVLRQARAALVASGTATLEAALLDCPTVIVYRTSLLTAALARCLLRVPHVGIVNLIAGREVCPERLQFAARPRALAAALLPLIEDGPARAAMLRGYAEVRAALGPPGAAERAAEIVLRALGVSR